MGCAVEGGWREVPVQCCAVQFWVERAVHVRMKGESVGVTRVELDAGHQCYLWCSASKSSVTLFSWLLASVHAAHMD